MANSLFFSSPMSRAIAGGKSKMDHQFLGDVDQMVPNALAIEKNGRSVSKSHMKMSPFMVHFLLIFTLLFCSATKEERSVKECLIEILNQ
jgi:hypothetical protein